MSLFDKTSENKSRSILLELIKDTVIKYLCIPNTTFLDEETKSEIVFPKVLHLKLIHNFMNPNVSLTNATILAFPNIKILDLEQIRLQR